ncbi:MAG: N-acetyl-gamma-glutamyl-phosphate reductase [Deltaproteobacteria bacterium]|nr:N-acetyl-gamma-glutamyl-phosphate reductase [Deltaproteobacteria bacterium]
MHRVLIFGASGYTGLELVHWLLWHPEVRLVAASSDRWAGRPVCAQVPAVDPSLLFTSHDEVLAQVSAGDVAFLATPAETSLALAPRLLDRGARVIDLSGAFRLAAAEAYPQWYGFTHSAAPLLAEAYYGLPELSPLSGRPRLIANPGCYATAAALAAAPLVARDLVLKDAPLIVDGKSGTTGAGRKADEALSFSEVDETVRPYRLTRHQHTPEMEQTLSRLAGRDVLVSFAPHLVPLRRGLIVAVYAPARPGVTQREVDAAFDELYRAAPFVRVLTDRPPEPGPVARTNLCDVGAWFDPHSRSILAFAALDNLVKGAAGQAIQNLNLMLGLAPTTGLFPRAGGHP